MLCLVDAGNTRVKWAIADTITDINADADNIGKWLANGEVSHDGVDQLGDHWNTALLTIGFDDTHVETMLISNVAGPAMRVQLEQQCAQLSGAHTKPAITWFASTAICGGVKNLYQEPARLGCDRLASMIGARALYAHQALLVVTCGTATTIDALSAEGAFVGGMILPGLGTMAHSLAQGTAQLPVIPPPMTAARRQPTSGGSTVFANNTNEAIEYGCLAAQAGAIERALAAHANARCIIAGGAAPWILPNLNVSATLVENLVLIGLQVVAIANTFGRP